MSSHPMLTSSMIDEIAVLLSKPQRRAFWADHAETVDVTLNIEERLHICERMAARSTGRDDATKRAWRVAADFERSALEHPGL